MLRSIFQVVFCPVLLVVPLITSMSEGTNVSHSTSIMLDGQCTVIQQTDFFIPKDLPDVNNTKSAAECCHACFAESNCVIYVWNALEGACYFKKSEIGRMFNPNCTAGRVTSRKPLAPAYHTCGSTDVLNKDLPFCNSKQPIESRLDDLIGRLNLSEKIGLMGSIPGTDACLFQDQGVPRLGIPGYMQCVETNTVVSALCVEDGRCSTAFPGPASMAATFNDTLWEMKGDVISTELRALNNNYGIRFHDGAYIGLTGWGPNINLARDPRFGRVSELPSEDPILNGLYAAAVVRGMQQMQPSPLLGKYYKMLSSLKHYTAYTIETNRFGINENISVYDLHDSYLPQYELAFTMAEPAGVMCSYASINGVPSCASPYLLNTLVRDVWGQSDAVVVTDCFAVRNMVDANKFATSMADASAKSINAGVDLNTGFPWTSGGLWDAVGNHTVAMATLDAALRRSLRQRFQSGLFDPLPVHPAAYTSIPLTAINSTAHYDLTLDAALQSLVLLKNSAARADTEAARVLPLEDTAGLTLAVVGPHAASHNLFSDYVEDQQCADGTRLCVPTIGDWLGRLNTGKTDVVQGVAINSDDASGVAAALAAVDAADVVVLCIGIDTTVEHEGIDRANITLPGLQVPFIEDVFVTAAGKPVVVVVVNGGVVALDPVVDRAAAIIEAFYPSQRGAEAIARAVFGLENRWGKLPVSLYAQKYTSQISLFDMNMTTGVGRTYRYLHPKTSSTLYDFGYGLSYTNFSLQCHLLPSAQPLQDRQSSATTGAPEPWSAPAVVVSPVAHHLRSRVDAAAWFNVSCTVRNIGNRAGDEVVIVYHSPSAAVRVAANHVLPQRRLIAFTRVHLKANELTIVEFATSTVALALTTADGTKKVYAGEHVLQFSHGIPGSDVSIPVIVSGR